MGTFAVTVEIGDRDAERWEQVEALVDTGSTYTWLPRRLLERLGVVPVRTDEFETADGRVVSRDVGQTWIRIDGRAVVTLVVFADDAGPPLLGAYAMEGLGLAADPLNRRLVRVRGLAMSAS